VVCSDSASWPRTTDYDRTTTDDNGATTDYDRATTGAHPSQRYIRERA
jgi:hypothetical protein